MAWPVYEGAWCGLAWLKCVVGAEGQGPNRGRLDRSRAYSEGYKEPVEVLERFCKTQHGGRSEAGRERPVEKLI